jgi:translation initiation factor 1
MRNRQKIPLNTASSNWSTPFENLSTSGLPPGQRVSPSTVPSPATTRRGRVVLRRETAHRGGKTVIVVHDFPLQVSHERIEELASQLKKVCGCGGTTKTRTIEIQGDQPGKIRAFLEAEGFRVAGVH